MDFAETRAGSGLRSIFTMMETRNCVASMVPKLY